MLPCGLRSFAELYVFGVADAIGRGENAVKANLLRVSDGVQEVGRERRLAARKENDDLATRLERDGVVEDRFRVFKRRLVNIADLIRIHEARVAHHVAAIRQVNREHCAATELDVGRAVTMNVGVFGCAKISPEEERFDAL